MPMNRQVQKYGRGAVEHNTERVSSTWDGGKAGRVALIVNDETDAAPAVAQANGASRRQNVARLVEELQRTREQLRSTSAAHNRAVAVLRTVNLTHQTRVDALQRTNAELRHVIESTGIGTLILDSAMRIRRFTPALDAIFDLVDADSRSPLALITHRLDYSGLVEDVKRVIGSRERIEREVRSDTGEWFIVRLNPFLSLDGEIDGAILTFFEHTAQHHIEEELRDAKTAAESANRAREVSLATLSHDLRSPLTAIMILTDILRFRTTLTAGQEQRITGIKAGGQHLASMIDGILGFAGMNAAHDVADRQTLDARVLAGEVHALMAPASDAKDLVFSLEVPDDVVALKTDIGKVRRVLINLCENAVKYTDAGEIRLRVLVERERVIFEVRDTGIGIAPENRRRIFDRFWQVDGRTIRPARGMGIGLTAAREYGRFLGGDVEVESELGKGSTFRLWLPGVCERR